MYEETLARNECVLRQSYCNHEMLSMNEHVGKLKEVEHETRYTDEGTVLIVEGGLVERGWHPIGQGILESDNVLVDQLLEWFVLVVIVARGQNIIDNDGAGGGDRRIDSVHLGLGFVGDTAFDEFSIGALDVDATTDADLLGIDGLAVLSSAIGLVDQVITGQRQFVSGFGGENVEFHAHLGLSVQPITDWRVFQLTLIVPGQNMSITFLRGQFAHADGSVFFGLDHISSVEATLLLASLTLAVVRAGGGWAGSLILAILASAAAFLD